MHQLIDPDETQPAAVADPHFRGVTFVIQGPMIAPASQADIGRRITEAVERATPRYPEPTSEQLAAAAAEREAWIAEAKAERAARLRREVLAGGALLAIVVAILALIFLAGCGASAVRGSAEAADTLGRVLDVAGDEIVTHREHDMVAAAHAGTTRAEGEAAVALVQAHWSPVVVAEEAAAIAQRAFADAVVELAAERTTVAHVLALLAPVARAYQALAAALEPVGLHLPALPPAVSALLPEGATP
jgi:hypothetical protein